MFTFMHFKLSPVVHARNNKPTEHENIRPPMPSASRENDAVQLNPWEKELARLAQRELTRASFRQTISSTLSRAQKAMSQPLQNFGTLQNLKIWWGNSTSTYQPPSVDLESFAPTRRRKPNRWFQ